jgi:hypothetical protein
MFTCLLPVSLILLSVTPTRISLGEDRHIRGFWHTEAGPKDSLREETMFHAASPPLSTKAGRAFTGWIDGWVDG